MGTNFFARILPSRDRRKEIKKAIETNDFSLIKKLISQTYESPYYDYDKGTFCGGEIHLGKRSGGWKFLWNPNWYELRKGHMETAKDEDGSERRIYVEDPSEVFKYYDLNKRSIKKFINRKDVEIYDEYGEKQDKKEFYKMAIEWGNNWENKGWDHEAYEKEEQKKNPNRREYVYESQYTRFLESCGLKLNKYKSEFYSNGLRFATVTEFS